MRRVQRKQDTRSWYDVKHTLIGTYVHTLEILDLMLT